MVKNQFLDLIKNRDNAEVAQEGNAAFGLGVDPTSLPLMPGLTNAELANEQYNQLAQQEAIEQPQIPAPARTPSSVTPSVPKKSATTSTTETTKTETVEETPLARLERLMNEMNGNRKKEMEDAQSRQLKIGMLNGVLGNIGNIVGGATAMNTKAAVTPVKATGIDVGDLVAQVEKKYKPDQEQLLTQYKELKDANTPMTDYQKEYLALAKEQHELAKQRAYDTNERFQVGEGNRMYKFGENLREKQELTPAQAKEVVQIQTTLDSLDKLESMKDFSTGPITGRIERAKRFLGEAPGNRTAMVSQLNMIVSQYGKAISGTAIGEKEFERIQQQLPNENDSDEQFAAKLANFKDSMNDSRLRVLDSYKLAGKDPSAFHNAKSIDQLRAEDEARRSGKREPSTAGTVKVRRISDGKVAEMSAERAASADPKKYEILK